MVLPEDLSRIRVTDDPLLTGRIFEPPNSSEKPRFNERCGNRTVKGVTFGGTKRLPRDKTSITMLKSIRMKKGKFSLKDVIFALVDGKKDGQILVYLFVHWISWLLLAGFVF